MREPHELLGVSVGDLWEQLLEGFWETLGVWDLVGATSQSPLASALHKRSPKPVTGLSQASPRKLPDSQAQISLTRQERLGASESHLTKLPLPQQPLTSLL